ncbi:hypothetical protein B0H34DRAFT_87411 [Crassisporium funariophilum]|nr:hypothetical protein B0H34DRAFT_87411 [Crassisporium funariophilum]
MQLMDLPMDILPEVIDHIIKPQHLASICLVSNAFRAFATNRLYERVSIYAWHKEGKVKVVKLFDTLARYAYLALHVHRLEIRDFPKAFTNLEDDLFSHVLRGLKNCVNLRSCTWTRDGSLNSEILLALQRCSNLRELEVNGHNDGNYDPRLLLGFTELNRISLIMPSLPVVSQLRPWLSITGHTLRALTLICKASSIVTDGTLESIAPFLVNLEHLYLTGCPKATHKGVWTIISANAQGPLGLGLEGVSPKFDMDVFASQCISSCALTRLRSITLTVHQQLPLNEWTKSVIKLLSASPLEFFQIYSTGVFFESPMTDIFWQQLISAHGQRLVRFSVHRMLIDLEAIMNICVKCINLEQLFVVVEPESLENLAKCLSHAKKLRTIHINYPLEAFMDSLPVLQPAQASSIIEQCSPTIVQFGCNTKVWQVGRTISVDGSGVLQARRHLMPYESPDVPEQFLVVRT